MQDATKRLPAKKRNGCGKASSAKERNSFLGKIRALAVYQDFLTVLKDADPDIPILRQAKAEYVKLQ